MTESGYLTRLSLPNGGEAGVVETDGARAVLVSSAPFPPGATLLGESDDGLGAYALKVRGCRREPPPTEMGAAPQEAAPPRFRVEGRWVNLSRPQRERLLGGS